MNQRMNYAVKNKKNKFYCKKAFSLDDKKL